MITVYLSGKMTGLAESEYNENFRKAEAERLGLEVMYYRTIGGKK